MSKTLFLMEFIPPPKGILNDIMKIIKNNIGTYGQVSLKVLATPAKSGGYGLTDLMVQQKGRHSYHLSSLLTNDDEDLQITIREQMIFHGVKASILANKIMEKEKKS